MSNYPIVFDKFSTSYTGYGDAILNNAKEVCIKERINGDKTLDLVLPRNDTKWKYIKNENFIKVERDLFIIRSTNEIKDDNGNLLSNIQCEFIFFELVDCYVYDSVKDLNAKEFIAQSAQIILDDVLSKTRFKADASRLIGLNDLWLENATAVMAIQEVRKLWKCEFVCNGLPDVDGKFKITFYESIGNDTGVQFRYKKNLQSIRRTIDSRDVTTRLYIYGKDGLGIRGATKNKTDKAYIDSQYINDYPRPKENYVYFRDIDNKDELYDKGKEHLEKVERPRVTYEANVLELKKIAGFNTELESFGLGDVINVLDDDLEVNVLERIVEYVRYPFEPKRSNVKLANFDAEMEDFLADLDNAKSLIENTTTERGRLNTHWLDGMINALQNRIVASGAYKTAEVRENEGILFENTDKTSADYGALYIGPNILAIADTKKSNGSWS
ncbi:MAG TPA: hypothetical protein GX497_13760 [Bacillus bacterium]|nr:hypothetical protein [Bacillus sp. (in: firmicutes)]